MPLKIKICGLKYPENIIEVKKLMPDYMGFIFYRSSPRFVGEGFNIPGGRPGPAARVGIFVNEEPKNILHIARQHQLTHIQLHGNEPPVSCSDLRNQGYRIIKAFGVHPDFEFKSLQAYADAVDFFLFDTRSEKYGGSGKIFDWTLMDNYQLSVPFFLSGGISAEILKAKKIPAHPMLHALDVNSGVEDRPGWKNVVKIKELIQMVNTVV